MEDEIEYAVIVEKIDGKLVYSVLDVDVADRIKAVNMIALFPTRKQSIDSIPEDFRKNRRDVFWENLIYPDHPYLRRVV